MAKQSKFSVSKRGIEPVEVTFMEPESITDPRWEELGVSQEAINDLATQSLVIKIQAGARGQLDGGRDKVQGFVDGYKYGQRTGGGGARKVVIRAEDAQKAGFTEEQIALLRAAGVSLPGMGDEATEGEGEDNAMENAGAAAEIAETTPAKGRGR